MNGMSATTESIDAVANHAPGTPSAAEDGGRAVRRHERARRDRRLRFTLVGFIGVAFIAIIAMHIFNTIGHRRDAERATIEVVEHFARVTDVHLRESFRAAELVLTQVDEFLDNAWAMRGAPRERVPVIAPVAPTGPPPPRALGPPSGPPYPQAFLRRRRDMSDHIHRITVFDPAGRPVIDTFHDRQQLDQVRSLGEWPIGPVATGLRLRIGMIMTDPDTRLAILPVARTITADGPLFGGMIVASLDASAILRFLRAVDPANAQAEVILYSHNRPFLRYPGLYPVDRPARDQHSAAALLDALAAGQRETVAHGPFDGIERTYIHRVLNPYPVTVAVGIDRHVSLAPWRADLTADLGAAALLALLMLMLGTMVFVQLRQREHSESALAESERQAHRLAMVAERTQNGVLIVNAQRRIEWANRGFQNLSGIEPAWILGEPLDEWLAWMGRRPADSFDLTGGIDIECETMAGDQERWLRIMVDPVFGDDGAPQAWIGIITDITERRQLERDMLASKESAEQASRAKSEFLANMSHELRTPLNAVIGFSEIMCKEMFGALGGTKYRDYANYINSSGKHLLALINDILDLSKVEAQKMTLSEDLVDLEALLDEVVAGLSVLAHNGKVTLERVDGEPTPLITCDQRAIRQVIYNLLSNAVKFTPEGGTVSVGLSSRDGGAVDLVICDTGIGISAEHLPRIMQPFEQVQAGFTRDRPGTGLGLALTRKLVELHGGTIEIESVEGEGTTVTVRFPASRVCGAEVPMIDVAA
jgi:PAS domain S-box-containing protein